MKANNFLVPYIFVLSALLISSSTKAQYAPPVGHAGTTAMYKDSTAFVAWATTCSVIRGYQDITTPSMGFVTVGDSSMAIGPAGTNGVVSLGDGGIATLTFAWPIVNGPGWDFAVFENSFDDYFLELAFVEVSSDGENFFRFPAHSLTDTSVQVAGFDSLDATKINNLAGKYRGMYGTPFDLEELSHIMSLDITRITHIRIIDVIGTIQKAYATYDTAGNIINDPFPTGFPQGGFDLDAVGVIWDQTNTIAENGTAGDIQLYPNPTQGLLWVSNPSVNQGSVMILYDLFGKEIFRKDINDGETRIQLDLSETPEGIYILQLIGKQGICTKKIIRQ